MSDAGPRESGRCTDAAAYVLDMLDPADRASFVEHADACPRCRTEIGELAGLLPLLAAGVEDRTATPPVPVPAPLPISPVPTAPVPTAPVPIAPVPTAPVPAPPARAGGAGTEPARRGVPMSWIAASAGLAAALALALFGVGALRSPATPATNASTSTVALTARSVVATPVAGGAGTPGSTNAAALVRSFPGLGTAAVEIAVRRTGSGSSLSIRCTGAVEHDPTSSTPGMVSLWVWTHTGQQVEVTAWTDMHAATTIDSATSVTPEDMSMLELRGPDGHRLSRVDI